MVLPGMTSKVPIVKIIVRGQRVSPVVHFIETLKGVLVSVTQVVGLASGGYLTGTVAYRDDCL
jgi:hypothetical protein